MSTLEPEHRGIYSGVHKDKSVSAWAGRQGYTLKFTHTKTGHSVAFPGNITTFSDSHVSVRKMTKIWEQNDPEVKQQNAYRKISFTFLVVNGSLDEARYNEQNLNLLLCMMYPKWDGTVKTGSTIRAKGLNFLKSSRPDSALNSDYGIELWLTSLKYELDLDAGVVTSANTGIHGEDEIYPVQIAISIAADVRVHKLTSDDGSPWPAQFPKYR